MWQAGACVQELSSVVQKQGTSVGKTLIVFQKQHVVSQLGSKCRQIDGGIPRMGSHNYFPLCTAKYQSVRDDGIGAVFQCTYMCSINQSKQIINTCLHLLILCA